MYFLDLRRDTETGESARKPLYINRDIFQKELLSKTFQLTQGEDPG